MSTTTDAKKRTHADVILSPPSDSTIPIDKTSDLGPDTKRVKDESSAVSPSSTTSQANELGTEFPALHMGESLRTIDVARSFSLLPELYQESTTHAVTGDSRWFNTFVVDDVLSPNECDMIISRATQLGQFVSLTHAYAESQRQAERQVVLDADLSKLLWDRLQKHHAFIASMAPNPMGFYHPIDTQNTITRSETCQVCCPSEVGWEPIGLNSGCRLSRYQAPSNGFAPHYDSPFVQNYATRSSLSLVLYLTDVGGTTFYDIPSDMKTSQWTSLTQPPSGPQAGMTVKEEIESRGGIDRYDKLPVLAKKGRCVIFSHSLLHAGDPVESGCKVILRTDVMMHNAHVRPNTTSHDFQLAADLFQQAQRLELQHQPDASSEMYERSLSLRQHAPSLKLIQHVTLQWCATTWASILDMLDYLDMGVVRTCNKTFRALVDRLQAFRKVRFHKANPRLSSVLSSLPPSSSSSSSSSSSTSSSMTSSILLPRRVSGNGSHAEYEYDAGVFDAAPEASLRAITMSAIADFTCTGEAYVAHYDAIRGTALVCSRDTLLLAAFHKRPVGGAWYSVNSLHAKGSAKLLPDQTVKAHPRRDFFKADSYSRDDICYYNLTAHLACCHKYPTAKALLPVVDDNPYLPPMEINEIPPFAGSLPGKTTVRTIGNGDVIGNQLIFDFTRAELKVEQLIRTDDCRESIAHTFQDCCGNEAGAKPHWVVVLQPLFATASHPTAFFHAGGPEFDFDDGDPSKIRHSTVAHVHIVQLPTIASTNKCMFRTHLNVVQSL